MLESLLKPFSDIFLLKLTSSLCLRIYPLLQLYIVLALHEAVAAVECYSLGRSYLLPESLLKLMNVSALHRKVQCSSRRYSCSVL